MAIAFRIAALAALGLGGTAFVGASGQTSSSAEMPSLTSCLADAGASGQATQVQLDACVAANLGEIQGVLPDAGTQPTSMATTVERENYQRSADEMTANETMTSPVSGNPEE
jgi:hypothetical protein